MDLIDRQQAIDEANAWLLECFKVQKQDRSCGLIRRLEDLQSAQKTGKWIVHTEIKNVYGGIYIECSECGESYVVQHLDAEIFCRTCGSKNGR